VDLSPSAALSLRMTSLLLRPHPLGNPGTVAGVVEWFGAMQAQDVASGLWSLGVRLPGATLADVNAALERREVLRTWPMRGTVHLVPAADAHWMLELMGVRALAGVARRRETIGLDAETAERGVEVLGEALAGGKRLTRAECLAALTGAGLRLGPQMGYHLLWYASQKGVTAIAPHVGKEQTFVLLDDWAPKPNRPSREEGLAIIARRFFRSHGPATVKDLVRWTGLTTKDVRAGIAGADLATVSVAGQEMFLDPAVGEPGPVEGWDVLPGFDEYLLGYGDRTMMLDKADETKVIPGGNGIFQATIVHAGRVVGTWKRTLGKAVTIDAFPLDSVQAPDTVFDRYGEFVGLPTVVRRPVP
jgi:hypothetical protein